MVVRDLTVTFPRPSGGEVAVVEGVSFDIRAGEILALVGESGSGKSITALSMLGLVPDPGRVSASTISLAGQDLVGLPFKEMRKIRGKDIGVIFQEPSASLNPAYTIGDQVAEPLRTHLGMSKKQARAAGDRAARAGRHPPGGRSASTTTPTSTRGAWRSG